MATFLLRWNPEISSFKEKDLTRLIERYPFVSLNWSVWDYWKASMWDDFFMMRVSNDRPGIMMKGRFSSYPKKGIDWTGIS